MRYYEIIKETTLFEAKLVFSKEDFEKAAADSEFGVIYLTMTGDGEIHIGEKWHARGNKNDKDYHLDASARRSLKMTLVPEKKQLDIRKGSLGNTLKPKVQQALRSLRDAGIIDNTWKIKTASEASGYAIGTDDDGYRTSKWTSFPNPVDTQGLDALADKAIRLSPVTQNIVLFHGTSELDWEKIQKVGLHPLGYGSNQTHGSESRAKHEGNTKVLYLAGSMAKAREYAKTRVDDMKRKKKIYDLEPVVLSVQVPDPVRLVSDDDIVNELARRIADKLFKSKTKEEQHRIMKELSAKRGFEIRDPTAGQMLWRETDEGFAEIMAKIPQRVFKMWKASLTREDQVGYKGIIPPKFIKRVL